MWMTLDSLHPPKFCYGLSTQDLKDPLPMPPTNDLVPYNMTPQQVLCPLHAQTELSLIQGRASMDSIFGVSHWCSIGLGLAVWRPGDAFSSLSHSLGHFWTVFVVLQCIKALPLWRGIAIVLGLHNVFGWCMSSGIHMDENNYNLVKRHQCHCGNTEGLA